MNRNEYIEERKKLLLHSAFYEKTDESNLQKQDTMLKTKLSTSNQIITKISIKTPRTPILYELHEIHKCFEKLPPLRPIVSGLNCISTSL